MRRKMTAALFGLLCLAVTTAATADTLGALKATLSKLNGQEPIRASVDRQIWHRSGDAKSPVVIQGKVNAQVEEGPQGLKILWSRATLQQATQEAKAQSLDPEKTAPTRRAMEGLQALELVDCFSGSEKLLLDLEESRVQGEKAEVWEGKPSICLTLKIAPRLSAQDKKYIKELDAVAKIWIGDDGVPLAAERTVKVEGRALLVISFQSEEHEVYRYTRVGDRLVTLSHVSESSGSGAGESGQGKTTTTLTLEGS